MPAETRTAMSHAVFFELEDKSPEAVNALIEGAREYLSGHEGVLFFSVGARAGDYAREVNDKVFDVSLLVAFESREAHDAYQVTDRHQKFIETQKDNWKSVRVFDSFYDPEGA